MYYYAIIISCYNAAMKHCCSVEELFRFHWGGFPHFETGIKDYMRTPCFLKRINASFLSLITLPSILKLNHHRVRHNVS